jgi:hypothetical protein
MAQTWLPIFVTVRCWSRRHSLISDNLPVPLRRVSCGRRYRGPNPRSVKFPLPRWPVAANYNWARTYKNGLEPILPVFRRHGPERLKACVMPVGVWCGRGVHSGPKLPTVAAGRDCLTPGRPSPSNRRGYSGSATSPAAPAPARLPPPVFPGRSDRLSVHGRWRRPSPRFDVEPKGQGQSVAERVAAGLQSSSRGIGSGAAHGIGAVGGDLLFSSQR